MSLTESKSDSQTISVYWDDLTPSKQAEILAAFGGNCNYDIFPHCGNTHHRGGIRMNGFPNKETVEYLRRMYPRGTRVELISMNDPYTRLKPGDRGTVSFVDDIGTVFVRWDCGSGLGVAYGADRIRKI